MADFVEEFKDTSAGVRLNAEGDQIPSNALTATWNGAFRVIDGQTAQIGKRPGSTRLSGQRVNGFSVKAAIRYLKRYTYQSKDLSTISDVLIGVDSEGEVFTVASDGTGLSSTPRSESFTYTDHIDSVSFKDLLLMVNGNNERNVWMNNTWAPFGCEPLGTISVTAASTGSASMPAETYTIRTTTYNSNTEQESSPSAETEVTLTAGQRIRVQVTPTAGETAAYTHWRIYLQRQTTQAQPYRVLVMENSGGSNIVTTGDIPIATTDVYVDLSAATIADLILVCPEDDSQNPLPDDVKLLAVFGNRVIGSDGRSIFWSSLNKPCEWPLGNTELVETGDSDQIVALANYSEDLLLILMSNSVWGLFGNDPQTWTLKLVTKAVGCVGHRSVCARSPAGVAWWAPTLGPVIFNGQDIEYPGRDLLGPDHTGLVLDTNYSTVVAEYHDEDNRILWSFKSGSSTFNNIIWPYNVRLKAFESSAWYGLRTTAMAPYMYGNKLVLALGDDYGLVRYFDSTKHNDGVPSGTVTGTFTGVTSTSSITGSGFYTSGEGLKGCYVTVWDATTLLPAGTSYVDSNTGTTLTLTTAITGLSSGTTYRYYVAPIDFRLGTKWFDAGQPFLRKRFDRLYLHLTSDYGEADSNSIQAYGLLRAEFDDGVSTAVTKNILIDNANWKQRFSFIKNGMAVRLSLSFPETNKDVVLRKVSFLGRVLSDRVMS